MIKLTNEVNINSVQPLQILSMVLGGADLGFG